MKGKSNNENKFETKICKDTLKLIRKIKERIGNFSDDTIINIALQKEVAFLEGHLCSICKNAYVGFGNNAEPINEGRCCDKCDERIVIPIRLLNAMKGGSKRKKDGFTKQT